MNATTSSPARAGGLGVRNSLVLAILAVAGTFVLAAAGLAFWREDGPTVEDGRAPKVQLHPEIAPARFRCETCGVIERIRAVEAIGAAPKTYEFAVRLPDGSLRFSSDPQRGNWQVGDRMQLLGGERTWNAR